MSSSTQHHQSSRSSEWTEEMRDKQARGKNPYSEESDVSDAEPRRLGPRYRSPASLSFGTETDSYSQIYETHMERERRREAMYILDNPAALMAHAQASGDVCILLYEYENGDHAKPSRTEYRWSTPPIYAPIMWFRR
jgi:hypothetical protein